MGTEILEDIGLTKGEIKVYLALLELGSSTAGAVLNKANIQNSVFHFCVNRLMEKGLVSYVRKGKVRIYKAVDPDNLLIYITDKKREIEELLPELKSRQRISKEKQQVELFEGIRGIVTLLNILIENVKNGDDFLFFSADANEKNKEIQLFYKKYDIKRKSRGLITKGISPVSLKSLFQKRTYLRMKYTDFPIPANTAICNDKMALISWDIKPIGVLIQGKNLVKKEKEFFYALWDMLK